MAADNIGGHTYHSKIPIPRTNIDREAIRLPTSSPRYKQLVATFANVAYIIIDEMSMVGRRSLGQIDEMLRHAKGCEAPLGYPCFFIGVPWWFSFPSCACFSVGKDFSSAHIGNM